MRNNIDTYEQIIQALLYEALIEVNPHIFRSKNPYRDIGEKIIDIVNTAKELLEAIPFIRSSVKEFVEKKFYKITSDKKVAKEYAKVLTNYILRKERPLNIIKLLKQIQLLPTETLHSETLQEIEKLMEELSRLTRSIGHFTDITKTLGLSINEIIRLLNNKDPCTYEYAVSLAFSVITQLKHNIIRIDIFDENMNPGVYWFGEIRRGTYCCAPRGVPDILVKLLSWEQFIVEATMSTTAQQWQREVEPAIRHAGDLDITDIILIVPELKEDTLARLKSVGEPYRLAILEREQLIRLVKFSHLIGFLPHSTILTSLLSQIFEVTHNVDSVEKYRNEVEQIIRKEATRMLPLTILRLLFTNKSKYRSRRKAVEQITREIHSRLQDLGITLKKDYLERKVRETFATLEKLGLIKRFDDVIDYISSDELLVWAQCMR